MTATPSRTLTRRIFVGCLLIVAFFLLGGVWLALTLPDIDQLQSCKPAAGIRGTTGASADCVMIEVAHLPPYLIQALLAAEDREFYRHTGIDPYAIARALLANLRAEKMVQGGSTITEQLAKRLLPLQESKLLRKAQEMMLALWIERRFPKDAILKFYLNRAYFGSGVYGIEAASQQYFGKTAQSITPYQAAMLVGLLRAPSRYNPRSDPALADRRARQVLQNMVESGFLTEEQARQAAAQQKTKP